MNYEVLDEAMFDRELKAIWQQLTECRSVLRTQMALVYDNSFAVHSVV